MSVSNGQAANETTFNDAFPSRVDDTSLSGKLNLLNVTESTSPTVGALVLAGGLGVAKNVHVGGVITGAQIKGTVKTYTNQVLTNGSTINYETSQSMQYRRVIGTSGLATIATLALGSNPSDLVDGAMIIFVGQSDSETVKFVHSDVQYGMLLMGDATLKRGYILRVFWDAVMERIVEDGRNF